MECRPRPPPYTFSKAGLGISNSYCRELGYRPPKSRSQLQKALICNIERLDFVSEDLMCKDLGSIFNLEFSRDGKILGAAYEGKSYVLYDSLNQKVVVCKENAHHECCNGISFITNQCFATFSDDYTSKIWDLRNLKSCVHILMGHNGWVKNAECVSGQKTLLTSAFDNSIRIYDLNTPDFHQYGKELIYMPDIMRMKLAPLTSDFMVISTRGGSIYKLANLDLRTLLQDFEKYEDYVLSLNSRSARTIDLTKVSLFNKRKNVLSFLHYNYVAEDASDWDEMATSLSIHPSEQCILARQERTERRRNDPLKVYWSGVYDLKDQAPQDRFQLPCDAFNSWDEEERNFEIPRGTSKYNDGTGIYPKIINRVLSKGKRDRLKSLSSAHKKKLHVHRLDKRRFVKGIGKPTHDDLYDCSFYTLEAQNSLGMIRENCFHPSGLFMCSPYQTGFRIFSFNSNCDDFVSASDAEVFKYDCRHLHLVKKLQDHAGETLCVKCHPLRPQIVSGCQMGTVNCYKGYFTD